MNRLLFICLLVIPLVISCGHTATPTVDIQATIQAAVSATLVAQPTNTPTPTPSKTPIPTPIPSKTPTPSTSNTSAIIGLIFCFGLPIFFSLTLLFANLYVKCNKQLKTFQTKLEDEIRTYEENLKRETEGYKNQIQVLNNSIQKQQKDSSSLLREQWLRRVGNLSYKGETEVKVKFVNSLVSFLGYQEDDFRLEVSVKLQIGHNSIQGKADVVLYEKTVSHNRKSFAVIEVKEPNIPMDNKVKNQARSYAMGLNAPIYAITNGKNLQIFRRGIEEDTCIVNCKVSRLAEEWAIISQTMGKNARITTAS